MCLSLYTNALLLRRFSDMLRRRHARQTSKDDSSPPQSRASTSDLTTKGSSVGRTFRFGKKLKVRVRTIDVHKHSQAGFCFGGIVLCLNDRQGSSCELRRLWYVCIHHTMPGLIRAFHTTLQSALNGRRHFHI